MDCTFHHTWEPLGVVCPDFFAFLVSDDVEGESNTCRNVAKYAKGGFVGPFGPCKRHELLELLHGTPTSKKWAVLPLG